MILKTYRSTQRIITLKYNKYKKSHAKNDFYCICVGSWHAMTFTMAEKFNKNVSKCFGGLAMARPYVLRVPAPCVARIKTHDVRLA
jgi:hypothetical protein